MDGHRFDAWLRALLARPPSRRALLGALAAGALLPTGTGAACPRVRRCGDRCCPTGKVCRTRACRDCRSDAECERQYGLRLPACVRGTCEQCGELDSGLSGDEVCEALQQDAPFCVDGECHQCRAGVTGDCPTGERCVEGVGVCRDDWCGDGRFDPELGETDQDCGGPCPAKCTLGARCRANGDCADGRTCVRLGGGSRKICAECAVDGDCDEGLACVGIVCKELRGGTCVRGSESCEPDISTCSPDPNALCWTTTEGRDVCAEFALRGDPCSAPCTSSEQCRERFGNRALCLVTHDASCSFECPRRLCGLEH